MARAEFSLEDAAFERMASAIKEYGAAAEDMISKYLLTPGADQIERGIAQFLPTSGRTWKGKKPAAKTTATATPNEVFQREMSKKEVLTLIIRTKEPYHYLYFPDDGSDTLRHWGDQQFMLAGAESASKEIINGAIERLTSELEAFL